MYLYVSIRIHMCMLYIYMYTYFYMHTYIYLSTCMYIYLYMYIKYIDPNISTQLSIVSTPNQDNPLMEGVDGYGTIPFLGLDVWEHSYCKFVSSL